MKKVFIGMALAAMLLLSSCRTTPGNIRTKKTYTYIDSHPRVVVVVDQEWLDRLYLLS